MDAQGFADQTLRTELATLKGLVPVNFVYRDHDDGTWYALPARVKQPPASLQETSWGSLIAQDGTYLELAGLEPGQAAERPGPGQPWRIRRLARKRQPPSDEHVDAGRALIKGRSDLLEALLFLPGLLLLLAVLFLWVLASPRWHDKPHLSWISAHDYASLALGIGLLLCALAVGSRRKPRWGFVAAIMLIAYAVPDLYLTGEPLLIPIVALVVAALSLLVSIRLWLAHRAFRRL